MTLILEYRDKIKKFYRMNAVVILPILKFMLAFIALNGVNTMMGYMPKLDNVAIVLISSLACSFLPAGCLTLLCMLFSLGHMYSLSMEVLIMGAAVYLLLYLMLLRFAPRDSYVVVLTPLLFALKIPYVVPVAVGLLGTPLSAVAVACGVLVYYFLNTIVGSVSSIKAMDDVEEITDKIRFLLDLIMKNKPALVIAGAFAVTVVVVYVIRRMSVEHAWTIAMVAGVLVNLVLLLLGDLRYDIGLSMGSAILGSILAILVAKVIEFFRFCVDYGRTEWVQFEDDEYYYYVKAVPKMNIAAATKTVKRINTNTQSISPVGERVRANGEGTRISAQSRNNASSGSRRVREEEESRNKADLDETRAMPQIKGNIPAWSDGKSSGETGQSRPRTPARSGSGMSSGGGSYGSSRTVTTERTARTGDNPYRQSSYSAKGVTMRSSQMAENEGSEETDDYEELF